jgi:spore maturation protein CgeB
MNLLFSGYHNPHYPTITEYIERAISFCGHKLYTFDDRCHIIPGRIRKKIQFLEHFDNKIINFRFVNKMVKLMPAIIIVSGGHRISSESILKARTLNIKTCLWTIDAPINFKPIINNAKYYDFIYCQGTEAIKILQQNKITNAKWLPMACDPQIHKPVFLNEEEKKKYSFDIAFVGSYYKNRQELFESLTEYNFGIWGPGWHVVSKDSPLKKCIKGYAIKPEIYNKIYSSSKIVIVCHYQNKEILCYQASPKVFEAMACKAFVLVDNQLDVFRIFKDNFHCVKFENVNQLIEKINYYLKHEDERRQIAENAYEEVINNHTYVHRIKKLFNDILENIT